MCFMGPDFLWPSIFSELPTLYYIIFKTGHTACWLLRWYYDAHR